jgi:hypothetical protein
MTKKPRVVEIEWLDAACTTSEATLEEIKKKDYKLRVIRFDVGYIVHQDKEYLFLCSCFTPPSKDDEEPFAQIASIPMKMIKKKRYLT